MFQLDADGRHKPGDFKWRLARLAGAWLWFAGWRLTTLTGELLSPSRLWTALRAPRGRVGKHPTRDATALPSDERLDRFN